MSRDSQATRRVCDGALESSVEVAATAGGWTDRLTCRHEVGRIINSNSMTPKFTLAFNGMSLEKQQHFYCYGNFVRQLLLIS